MWYSLLIDQPSYGMDSALHSEYISFPAFANTELHYLVTDTWQSSARIQCYSTVPFLDMHKLTCGVTVIWVLLWLLAVLTIWIFVIKVMKIIGKYPIITITTHNWPWRPHTDAFRLPTSSIAWLMSHTVTWLSHAVLLTLDCECWLWINSMNRNAMSPTQSHANTGNYGMTQWLGGWFWPLDFPWPVPDLFYRWPLSG